MLNWCSYCNFKVIMTFWSELKWPCSRDNSGLVAEAWSLAQGNPSCDSSAEILVHLILQVFSLFFISSAPGWEAMKKKKKKTADISQKKYPLPVFPRSTIIKIGEITEYNLLGKTFLLRMKSKIILQCFLKSYYYHCTSVLLCINNIFK